MQKASEPANKMLTETKDTDQPDVTASIATCLERLRAQPADYRPREPCDWESGNALLLSAAVGDEVAVRSLVDGGADVNYIQWARRYARMGQGGTALHLAVQNNHRRIVEQLTNSGAHMNPIDPRGRTPLSWTAGVGHTDIATCLIDKGARLDIDDIDERTISSTAPELLLAIQPFVVLSNRYD